MFSSNSRRSFLVAAAALFVMPASGYAIGFSESLVVREDVAALSTGADARSFDGLGFDLLADFSEFTSGELFQVDPFAPLSGSSSIEVTLLSEVCGFCGQEPDFTDSFGLLGPDGEFVSIIDGGPAVAGDTASIEIEGDGEFTLALQSPQTILSAVDADNEDSSAHILAAVVENSGTAVIDNADLFGASLAFDLEVGDILIFVEDLLASGNTVPFVPEAGDFDFNDLVFVVREVALGGTIGALEEGEGETALPDLVDAEPGAATEVPEPSTYLLLLLGLFGFAARSRTARS